MELTTPGERFGHTGCETHGVAALTGSVHHTSIVLMLARYSFHQSYIPLFANCPSKYLNLCTLMCGYVGPDFGMPSNRPGITFSHHKLRLVRAEYDWGSGLDIEGRKLWVARLRRHKRVQAESDTRGRHARQQHQRHHAHHRVQPLLRNLHLWGLCFILETRCLCLWKVSPLTFSHLYFSQTLKPKPRNMHHWLFFCHKNINTVSDAFAEYGVAVISSPIWTE